MKQVLCAKIPGFLLTELLMACAVTSIAITMLIQWQGVLITRKTYALQKLDLIAQTQSSLDRISIDDSFKIKGNCNQNGMKSEWLIRTIQLNDLDALLSKSAMPGYFSFIDLTASCAMDKKSKVFHAYKGLS